MITDSAPEWPLSEPKSAKRRWRVTPVTAQLRAALSTRAAVIQRCETC